MRLSYDPSALPDGSAGAAQRVLLVDDERAARETLAEMLEDLGLQVSSAANGQRARELLETERFDLALLDIRLPDIQGTDLLVEARRLQPYMKCIMASGSTMLDSAVESLNQGAYAYLMKPVSPDEVRLTVHRALEQQRLEVENRRLFFQLQAVSEITDAGLASLELDALLPRILNRFVHYHNCTTGTIYLYDRDRELFRPAATHGIEETPTPAATGDGPLGRAVEANGLVIETTGGGPDGSPTVHRATAPLTARRDLVGAIELACSKDEPFTDDQIALLELFCDRAGLLIGNARLYDAEKTIAQTLVQSFLSRPPARDDLQIADRYFPLSQLAQIGGDYYDFIDLGDRRLGIVIGDVCGKGLTAAVYTARAKDILYAYARENSSPAWVVSRVNRALHDQLSDRAMFTTLFYGVFNPEDGSLVYTNAAHPAGLLYNPRDGRVRELGTTGGVVGALEELTYAEETVILEPGAVLALYTDGVTEARLGGEMLETEGVRDVVMRCAGGSPDELADGIYNRAMEFSGGDLHDDVAIVVLKYCG